MRWAQLGPVQPVQHKGGRLDGAVTLLRRMAGFQRQALMLTAGEPESADEQRTPTERQAEIESAVGDFAERAEAGKLTLEQLAGVLLED